MVEIAPAGAIYLASLAVGDIRDLALRARPVFRLTADRSWIAGCGREYFAPSGEGMVENRAAARFYLASLAQVV